MKIIKSVALSLCLSSGSLAFASFSHQDSSSSDILLQRKVENLAVLIQGEYGAERLAFYRKLANLMSGGNHQFDIAAMALSRTSVMNELIQSVRAKDIIVSGYALWLLGSIAKVAPQSAKDILASGIMTTLVSIIKKNQHNTLSSLTLINRILFHSRSVARKELCRLGFLPIMRELIDHHDVKFQKIAKSSDTLIYDKRDELSVARALLLCPDARDVENGIQWLYEASLENVEKLKRHDIRKELSPLLKRDDINDQVLIELYMNLGSQ